MRVLCTADWHLGKTLEGRDRGPEQEAFVDEICTIVEGEGVDLILIAGDVFDTYNPPASAERLFYEGVSRLADGGRRAVVVLAGNHDSPDRLVAADPLAAASGVFVLGYPHAQATVDKPSRSLRSGRVTRVAAKPSFLTLAFPGFGYEVCVAALPYPSESRLRRALPEFTDDVARQRSYSESVGELLGTLATDFRADTVNLAMSHFYCVDVGDAAETGSGDQSGERPIEVGGVCAVLPSALPASAQFVALGHLHRPQTVKGAPCPCMYPGSPLSYSFSEAGQVKRVLLVDVEPGETARVTEHALVSGRPLERWVAHGGLPEVNGWLSAGRGAGSWIDLELHTDTYPNPTEIRALRDALEGLVIIRPVIAGALPRPTAERSLDDYTLTEQFSLFCTRVSGAEPSADLTRLFVELVAAGEDEVQGTPEEVDGQ